MNANLLQIQPFIQAFVHAISAILNVEVTVVNKGLIRIAATSRYAAQIGQKISHASFFEQVLATQQPSIVTNKMDDAICIDCGNRPYCSEFADIAYPIFYQNEVCGVISIAAFTEQEHQSLLNNSLNFEQFLKYMSMLIESNMASIDHNQELELQLDEAINITQKSFFEANFIGQSPAILKIIELANKISDSQSTVLITGESGTGKEVLAKLIHNQSKQNNKLMISINCSAIPEHLVESELFGYEGGAFTGANPKGAIGKFELANNSTLFLDEIGEMPLAVQSKLLRVLQEQEVTRVGGHHCIPINVRVICATNQNLYQRVLDGLFRQDLFYRINVIPINLPSLRQRREDIPLLITHFTQYYNKKFRKNIKMTQEVLDSLMHYNWPGNIRELRNIIEYLFNIKENQKVELSDLPNQIIIPTKTYQHKDNELFYLKNLLAEHEKFILQKSLSKAVTTKEKKLIAKRLGIGLSTLYKKMELYHLLE